MIPIPALSPGYRPAPASLQVLKIEPGLTLLIEPGLTLLIEPGLTLFGRSYPASGLLCIGG
jgi:hypothetical protein